LNVADADEVQYLEFAAAPPRPGSHLLVTPQKCSRLFYDN
jgi:hypothetical protein